MIGGAGDADVGKDLLAAVAALEEALDFPASDPGPGELIPKIGEDGLTILFFNRLIVNGRPARP